jgi:SAM-dependent methyltransferase
MIHQLKQLYAREMFNPSLPGIFINPYYHIRKGLYKGITKNKDYLNGKLLDFGCGQKPYKPLFSVQEYIGVDIEKSGHSHENEQIDVFYDGKTIPFPDNTFDSVFSSEVFEHVFNLDEILKELYRVTKPGGYLLATMPFAWEEHEVPFDFARYTSFGIDHLLKKAGFEVIKVDKTTHSVQTIFQMWNAYIYHHVFPANKILRLILTPVFIAPVTLLGMLFAVFLPKNQHFYHNNVVVFRKP